MDLYLMDSRPPERTIPPETHEGGIFLTRQLRTRAPACAGPTHPAHCHRRGGQQAAAGRKGGAEVYCPDGAGQGAAAQCVAGCWWYCWAGRHGPAPERAPDDCVLQQVRGSHAGSQSLGLGGWVAAAVHETARVPAVPQALRASAEGGVHGSRDRCWELRRATTTSWVPDAPGPECCLEPVERLLR